MVQDKALPAIRAGFITIVLACVLVFIKAVAFLLSGSLAVLSSLLDSLIDVVVSAMNTWAIRYSAKPADEEHRYGHGKVEGLAALVQASLITAAAAFLGFEALSRLVAPQPIQAHILVIAVMMISAVFSLLIVFIQNRAFQKSGSLALEADKAHYNSDIVLHGGVIMAVVLQYYDGPAWIDVVFAFAVVAWLGFTACSIAMKGLDMVLDRELPAGERSRILRAIRNHPGVLGVHDLRTTRSGMKEIIDFDIEADPFLSLKDAHAITKDIEREILRIFPHAEIMIHVDPHGEIEDSRHTVAGVHH